MNGLLLIDKPRGLTSHDVVRRVRRILQQRRVGHAGTLDPMATGVLPVAVGEGTRLIEFLMAGDKVYRATLRLGETTDTQDAEGTVLERRPVGELTPVRLQEAASRLTGVIRQLPPMFSALKKNGVPLHRLARQGLEVEREVREITIHHFEIQAIRLPEVEIEVACSKGTYVRTLAHDFGQDLGCGAHLTRLQRVRNGAFDIADCQSLAELEGGEIRLLTPLQMLAGRPIFELEPAAVARLANGIPPALGETSGSLGVAEGELVALTTRETLRAAALFAPSREVEKRGDFRLLRVFHDGGQTE